MKKLIIAVLVIWGLFVFYKKFCASTFEPFFKEKSGKVDMLQLQTTAERAGFK